jgi:ribosomal protein S18 acetylase RimI-like enzyme
MIIRESEVSDKKALTEMYYQLYPNFKGAKKEISPNKIQAKNLIFLAEDSSKVVGFVWGTFVSYGISKYGYIEELFVEEKYRRRHLGTQLVKRLLEGYKKLGVWALFVMTREEDSEVQAFYKGLGFRKSKGLWLYMEW